MNRLLLLTEHYPPTMGGVATSAQRISHAIQRTGIHVSAVTFDHSQPLDAEDYCIEENDDGLMVRRIGPYFLKNEDPRVALLSEKHRATFRRRFFNTLLEIARSDRFDAILSLYLLNAGFIAGLVANALRVPHLAGVRGNDIGRNIFDIQRFGVIQWVLDQASTIVCVNSHLRARTLTAFPQHQHKTFVVANGVAPTILSNLESSRSALMAKTGWSNQDTIFVFIGSPREKKGIVPLLRAFVLLEPRIQARLLIVGPPLSGAESQIVQPEWEMLKANGRLFVTGLLSRQEVPAAAAGGDVIVMPSLDDGMANGLLEGMSLGLCPLVSPIFSDVVGDNEGGVILQQITAEEIARAITLMCSDREAVNAQGAKARQHILAHHLPDHEGQRYAALVEAALGGPKS